MAQLLPHSPVGVALPPVAPTHLLFPLLQFRSEDAELDLGGFTAAVLTVAQSGAKPVGDHRDQSRYRCGGSLVRCTGVRSGTEGQLTEGQLTTATS